MKTRTGDRLRVLMVGGFPVAGSLGGSFNLYAAQAVSTLADIDVLCTRAWKPGRLPLSRTTIGGIDVTVVAAPQIPGQPTLNRGLYKWFGWPLVRRLVPRFDVVHSVDGSGPGVYVSAWTRRAGVPHVTQIVGGDVNAMLPKHRHSRFIAGWERHLHGVACNSHQLRRSFLELYPDVPNVRVIHRGVNVESFSPDGERSTPFASRRGTRYVYVGGFPDYLDIFARANTKGGLTLLEAWRLAEDELRARDASLVVAGPYSESAIAAEALGALRYRDNVHVLPFVPHGDLPALLRGGDVVLVPSLQEGLPNIAMEASATGRPVFGTRIPGTEEVVVDGDTGVLLPAGDAPALAKLLVAYASRPASLAEMGRRARERMIRQFNQRDFGPKALALYTDAIALHRAATAARGATANLDPTELK